jgi:hypothetical protein
MNKTVHGRASRLASALAVACLLAGCAGTDIEIDAPILEAAGINLNSKPPPEPDLEERPPLVLPPDTQRLPEPGTRTAAVDQQVWPDDPDQRAKREAELAEQQRREYCERGDWSGQGNIEEFNRSIGRQERCQTTLGEAFSRGLAGDSQDVRPNSE